MNSDVLPEHDSVAERQIIGSCLLSPKETIGSCIESLQGGPETFFDFKNRVAWTAILAVYSSGQPVCMDIVWRHIESLGGSKEHCPTRAELDSAQDGCVPSAVNFYAGLLNAAWSKRRSLAIWAEATLQLQSGADPLEVLAKTQKHFLDRSEGLRRSNRVSAKEACIILTEDLERRFALEGKLSGIETGLSELDKMTDGFQFGEQTVVAGRPSGGKSAFGVNLISRVCVHDKIPSLFVTLEMSVGALMRRLLSCNKMIPMFVLKKGSFIQADMTKTVNFTGSVSKDKLFFLDFVGGAAIDRVCSGIRHACQHDGVKFVVIDYLQKIRPVTKHEKRTYEVADVSGLLKACALDTGAAFVTLAQLSREPDKDKGRVPRLSDLADSSQIERDADTVLLIHRPRTDDDPHGENAKLVVAKQRDGETGIINVHFDGRYCLFSNRPQPAMACAIPPSRTHADA